MVTDSPLGISHSKPNKEPNHECSLSAVKRIIEYRKSVQIELKRVLNSTYVLGRAAHGLRFTGHSKICNDNITANTDVLKPCYR